MSHCLSISLQYTTGPILLHSFKGLSNWEGTGSLSKSCTNILPIRVRFIYFVHYNNVSYIYQVVGCSVTLLACSKWQRWESSPILKLRCNRMLIPFLEISPSNRDNASSKRDEVFRLFIFAHRTEGAWSSLIGSKLFSFAVELLTRQAGKCYKEREPMSSSIFMVSFIKSAGPQGFNNLIEALVRVELERQIRRFHFRLPQPVEIRRASQRWTRSCIPLPSKEFVCFVIAEFNTNYDTQIYRIECNIFVALDGFLGSLLWQEQQW